jgi:DNA-binding NtrC family response regulator
VAFKTLIIDDDYILRSSLEEILVENSMVGHITHAENGKRGLDRLNNEDYDLVFLDIDLPMLSGMDVLRQSIPHHPERIYILMTAFGKISDAVEAMRLGAFNYIEKPLRPQAVNNLLNEIAEAKDLMSSVEQLSPLAFEEGKEIIGKTSKVDEVLGLIQRLAKVTTPVLIQGESGTGKELVARALHFNSPRKAAPFVTTNCSAVPETLFESEFFGHEKGSFTGADEKKIGKFQYAQGGTLFLDEVGDLSLTNQVKLLRVLQEKKYSPVGSHLEIPYDVRIVAATHKNLENMVERGEFRQDLYFRLNVMGLSLPSLRERRADIPDLIKVFIKKLNHKHSKEVLGCRQDYLEALMAYDFPGNIRELENAIERGFVLTDGQWLEVPSLPPQMKSSKIQVETSNSEESLTESSKDLTPEIRVDSSDLDFQKNKDEFEKKFIVEALKRNKGMLNQTALQANIPKKTLQRKIQKYGIDLSEFKSKK